MHPKVPHPKQLLQREVNGYQRFNKALTKKLAGVLGSMEFFYACVVMDLLMLAPVIAAHSLVLWVTYLAQTVIQLLALPVLQVYQNLMQEMGDAKADADHQALTHIAKTGDDILKAISKGKSRG